jgi:hypothetical protein
LAWVGAIAAGARVTGFMPVILILLLLVLNVAGLAAFVIARQRSRHRLLLALSMAPLAAALGTASNLLFRLAGIRVDISGFYNDAGLFAVLLVYGALAPTVGGLFGIWTTRNSADEILATVSSLPAATEVLPEISVAPVPATHLPQIRSD